MRNCTKRERKYYVFKLRQGKRKYEFVHGKVCHDFFKSSLQLLRNGQDYTVDFSSDLNGAKQKHWFIFFFVNLFIMFFISHPRRLGRKREEMSLENSSTRIKVDKASCCLCTIDSKNFLLKVSMDLLSFSSSRINRLNRLTHEQVWIISKNVFEPLECSLRLD